MRTVDNAAIAQAGARRFRSEYHYALFEYLRSAKVIEAVERAGVRIAGRVLDSGCGGGGTALSLAEEAGFTVGLDVEPAFSAGRRLAAERAIANVGFVQGDGTHLPFRGSSFDLVLSHSVIEHLPSAPAYLGECLRVLRNGGILYLSTAPYLSMAGAHLPRLRLPIPLHLVLGRRLAFLCFRGLARHAPWALKEPRDANTFVALAEQGRTKQDDLRQRITVRRLGAWIRASGFEILREECHPAGIFRRFLPDPARRVLGRLPWARDVMVAQIQYVLARPR